MPTAKKSAPSTKKSTAPSAAKKKLGRPPAGGINKSAFIREQPASLSAKEVVAKAKAKGIEVSEGFVYTTRSQARKSAQKAGATASAKKLGRPPKAAGEASSDLEDKIRKLAWTYGFPAVEAATKKVKEGAGL